MQNKLLHNFLLTYLYFLGFKWIEMQTMLSLLPTQIRKSANIFTYCLESKLHIITIYAMYIVRNAMFSDFHLKINLQMGV